MNAAVARVLGERLPHAGIPLTTIGFDPARPGEIQKRRTGFVTLRQINEGCGRFADGAVPRHVPRPRA
jgi:hypothetical protein